MATLIRLGRNLKHKVSGLSQSLVDRSLYLVSDPNHLFFVYFQFKHSYITYLITI